MVEEQSSRFTATLKPNEISVGHGIGGTTRSQVIEIVEDTQIFAGEENGGFIRVECMTSSSSDEDSSKKLNMQKAKSLDDIIPEEDDNDAVKQYEHKQSTIDEIAIAEDIQQVYFDTDR